MNASLKSFANHIDPEKEDQLKWSKKEIEEQVKRVLKLTKNINHGNKERNLRKKAEAIQLIQQFQNHYNSLYSLHEDLITEVKKKFGDGNHHDENDDGYSTASSDSNYYSTAEINPRHPKLARGISRMSDSSNPDPESSDIEDTMLKDKLTSSSEVKKIMNLDSQSAFTKTLEFSEIIKDMRIQEESEKTSHMMAQIKDLEGQVVDLKQEITTICNDKANLEEQVGRKSDEAVQMKDKISKLEAQISEVEAKYKDNESQLSELRKNSEDDEQRYGSRILDFMAKEKSMNKELNTLKHLNGELELKYSQETKQWSSQVKGLTEQLNSVRKELVSVNSHKSELELALESKSEQTSQCLLRIEGLRKELALSVQRTTYEKERLKAQIKDLEQEISSLSNKKSELEEEVKKINAQACETNEEKEKLREKISHLQISLSERESELVTEQKKFNSCHKLMTTKNKSLLEEIKSLKQKLESLENEREDLQAEFEASQTELEKEREESHIKKSRMVKQNSELCIRVAHQQETLVDLEGLVSKLRDENAQTQSRLSCSKSSLNMMERKMEEMTEEFRKQFEDKCRILSRRIRVAEQLQAENKEWFGKSKVAYEQENQELKERVARTETGLKNVKDMTLVANDVLSTVDTVALKFEECTAHFLNRISKASCELKFAKHWAMRKNKALLHLGEELDCLLHQLDDKEKEILVFREKVWKSDNKIRELEKLLKEKEEAMLGLKEEKREAIRQLCVWIDYHRGRSDYYKKMLTDINAGRSRVS